MNTRTCLLTTILICCGLAAAAAAAPGDHPVTLGGAYAHAFPGGDLLQELEPGPGLAIGLQAAINERFYLKLEGMKLDPGIDPGSIYVVGDDQQSALLTDNYDYRDLCLLAGVNLGLPRIGRPHLYLEVGGGMGYEAFDRTGIDLANGDLSPTNPDLVFFVLAAGGGLKLPVHSRLAVDVGLSLRAHWDSDPGTGFFDPTTGGQVPLEDFEGSSVQAGTLLVLRAGAAWTLF